MITKTAKHEGGTTAYQRDEIIARLRAHDARPDRDGYRLRDQTVTGRDVER
jgi:hypothetical protein